MSKRCDCADWAENIPKVNAPFLLSGILSAVRGYEGKPFTHCPWCGTPLRERDSLAHRRKDAKP